MKDSVQITITIKSIIKITLILVISFIICFVVLSKSNGGFIDTNHYDKTIDSLNQVIVKHDKNIDSLNNSINNRTLIIENYEEQLTLLNNKFYLQRKEYEKNINRINGMSNSDIASEFTNTFR
jgi:uncharacterized coiled-coil protein SlyX